MEVDSLFKGIAVIVDDEIDNSNSNIYKIKTLIEEKNIPVLGYKAVPDIQIIDSLNSVSFIILDWQYFKTLQNVDDPSESLETGEHLLPPATLTEDTRNKLLAFIDALISRLFIPVFIFTDQNKEDIQNALSEHDLWSTTKANRIFIKQKNELKTADDLFAAIKSWLKEMPSVYVLKEWERAAEKAKNIMFLNMYKYSSNWTRIIWDMIEQDSIENEREFGEFLTNSFSNRMTDYSFDKDMIGTKKDVPRKELAAIIEAERYINYAQTDILNIHQAYAGDLFKKEGSYFLNIRAQCDLSRGKEEEYNPLLYCVRARLK